MDLTAKHQVHVQPSNQPATWFPGLLTPGMKAAGDAQTLPTLSVSAPLSVIYVSGTRSQASLRTRTNTQAS